MGRQRGITQEGNEMEFNKIKEAAENYREAMTKFLRDLVRIPGESAGEKGHIDHIAQEMKALEFDRVEIDPMGNVLGYMGPVSYTHLDVYKRQSPVPAVPHAGYPQGRYW